MTEERIPEIDVDQLHADLYMAWQKLEKGDYHSATNLVAKSWKHVQEFRLSLDHDAEEPDGDGVWHIQGDPQIIERLRAVLEQPNKRSRWGDILLLAEPGGYMELPATTDRHPCAMAYKALYAMRNFINRLPGGKTWHCWREGYTCEWVYPYGWVPEGGCPRHD
jgi:hypothetical protein